MKRENQDKYREEARRKIEEAKKASASRGFRHSGKAAASHRAGDKAGTPTDGGKPESPKLQTWNSLQPAKTDSRRQVKPRISDKRPGADVQRTVQPSASRPQMVASDRTPHEKAELNQRLRVIQKRRDRSRTIILSVIVLLVLGVTATLIYLIINQRNSIANLQFIYEDSLMESYEANALIIRDEEQIASDTGGIIEPVVAEGYYARVGQDLAMVIGGDMNQTLQELENYERQISDLQLELISEGKTVGASAVYAEIDQEMKPMIGELRHEIADGNFQGISSQASSLEISLEKRNDLLADVVFDNAMLDSLRAEAAVLEQQLAVHARKLNSEKAGLVSFLSDGLEDELSTDRAASLTREEVQAYLENPGDMSLLPQTIVAGQPVLRRVYSVDQYFAMMIEDISYSYFTDRTHFDFYIPEEGVRIKNVEIVRTEPSTQGVFVIAKTDQEASRLLGRRSVEADIIAKEVKGLKVPISALRVEDELAGSASVMAVQNGYYASVDVEVLASDENFAIVKATGEGQILNQGSLVVLNPNSVEEGTLVNG